jgi:hypothetical protein
MKTKRVGRVSVSVTRQIEPSNVELRCDTNSLVGWATLFCPPFAITEFIPRGHEKHVPTLHKLFTEKFE